MAVGSGDGVGEGVGVDVGTGVDVAVGEGVGDGVGVDVGAAVAVGIGEGSVSEPMQAEIVAAGSNATITRSTNFLTESITTQYVNRRGTVSIIIAEPRLGFPTISQSKSRWRRDDALFPS